MKEKFFKFPSTPHLAAFADMDFRSDKLLSDAERNAFLQQNLLVEEKIDGANLGISFDSEGNLLAQNRGAYLFLPGAGQWKKLNEWLAPRQDELFEHLSDQFILFGEWCYAQHSVYYDHLPDWFLGFDIFDKRSGRFLSSQCRDALLKGMGIAQVPFVTRGKFTLPQLHEILSVLDSKFGSQPAEGIYLRNDDGDWLVQRAKLVRASFVQAQAEHWSRSAIKPNRLGSQR